MVAHSLIPRPPFSLEGGLGMRLDCTNVHGWTHTPINWVSYSTGADLVKLSVAFVTLSDHGDEMSSHPMSAGTESRRT